MRWLYRFPANRRAALASLDEQLAYMGGEVSEAVQAHLEGEGDDRIIEETLDAMQCGEGVLRKFPRRKVIAGLVRVRRKCRARGDYR